MTLQHQCHSRSTTGGAYFSESSSGLVFIVITEDWVLYLPSIYLNLHKASTPNSLGGDSALGIRKNILKNKYN
jgi:hypothetical protein